MFKVNISTGQDSTYFFNEQLALPAMKCLPYYMFLGRTGRQRQQLVKKKQCRTTALTAFESSSGRDDTSHVSVVDFLVALDKRIWSCDSCDLQHSKAAWCEHCSNRKPCC